MQPYLARTRLIAATLFLSACGLGTDPPPPPPVPRAFEAEPAGTDAIALRWAADASASEFRIQRSAGSGVFETVATVGGDARALVDTGLEPGEAYAYRIAACGEGGCSPPAEAAAVTFAPMEIVTESLPPASVGVPYFDAVDAIGGDGDYFWSVTAGAFPAGLALGDTSGIITGTPEADGSYSFTLLVRDGGGRTASRNYTVVVRPDPPPLSIENAALPPLMEGGAYRVELEGNGGDGTSYTWSVVGGSLPPGLDLDPGGRITGTAGAAGTYALTLQVASAGETTSRDFSIRVVPNRTGRFDITVYGIEAIPAPLRPAVEEATRRWEAAITGDLPPVSVPAGFFEPSGCGGFGDAVNGTTTDDIIMIVNIAPIDGPGKVLGRAGPCAVRGGAGMAPGLPFVGVLTLDQGDLEPLIDTPSLTDLVFHEMGHVLGFGSLWRSLDLVETTTTGDPRYVGERGVQAWQALGGDGAVPVANTGGTGTARVHWREAVFDREIMTGYSEPVGVAQPLSALSVVSMADLGYRVDPSAADPYDLPATLGDRSRAGTAGYDHVLTGPILVLDERGRRSVLRP